MSDGLDRLVTTTILPVQKNACDFAVVIWAREKAHSLSRHRCEIRGNLRLVRAVPKHAENLRQVRVVLIARLWDAANADRVPYVVQNFVNGTIERQVWGGELLSHEV